jgi:hypothetical protein
MKALEACADDSERYPHLFSLLKIQLAFMELEKDEYVQWVRRTRADNCRVHDNIVHSIRECLLRHGAL